MNINFKDSVLAKLKELQQTNDPTFLVVLVKHEMSHQEEFQLFRKVDQGTVNIDSAHDWEKEDRRVWPRLAHILGLFDAIVEAAIDNTVPTPDQPLA